MQGENNWTSARDNFFFLSPGIKPPLMPGFLVKILDCYSLLQGFEWSIEFKKSDEFQSWLRMNWMILNEMKTLIKKSFTKSLHLSVIVSQCCQLPDIITEIYHNFNCNSIIDNKKFKIILKNDGNLKSIDVVDGELNNTRL